MEEKAQFGIGLVSGRPNVCAVINNTYKHLLNQTKKWQKGYSKKVKWRMHTNNLVMQNLF